ncbi:MAG TPA: VWA domain-containing protein [Gammaproteobacteria bacterium]|nr:VWA domain-containing protein [Gammaproteobacteria bacterium]HIK70547.1 VWA domain-containing protein [Pseudomonadales bacterium]|tara:strand:+ start:62 stop:1213 length:1152 start_codon:yes stop_codon:yes gene_type:complete
MLINFFMELKKARIPVSITELLQLIEVLKARLVYADIDEFYYLSRMTMVKDERHYDKFDRAFSAYFKGLEDLASLLSSLIPDEYLRREFEKSLTKEELEKIKSLGGLEKLIEAFKKEVEKAARGEGDKKDQEGKGKNGRGKEGDDKRGKKRRGRRQWDKRDYKGYDDNVELGTRGMKISMRRLRKLARTGADDEFDIDTTISKTAKNGGLLDIIMRPERKNTVKVLLLLDNGGSMDSHVRVCEELFSAARSEFKHLETYYFHNFIYDGVWKEHRRRMNERIDTHDILHKYSHDYKVIFVGDATMAPYEITHSGGSVEHWNEEAGAVWFQRVQDNFDKVIWINPTPLDTWEYSTSVGLTKKLIEDQMFPLTIRGIEEGMNFLSK